ncbi:MAG: hypothetical protein K6G01_01935 [Eubacterium sp.]|nr:hypothetical protein [Eubacterium sp.]
MKRRKIIALMLTVLVMVSTCVMNVSAKEYETDNGKHKFNKAWEVSKRFGNEKKFVYGFNTIAIDEDYAHSNLKYSQAYLVNANGKFRANANLHSKWSKIEVTHKGNVVLYGVKY